MKDTKVVDLQRERMREYRKQEKCENVVSIFVKVKASQKRQR
jgi:hypothetical protein